MNRIMKLPISVAWVILMVLVFTFVDYTWISSAAAKMFFCMLCILIGGVLTAMNHDLKFWKYHE